MCVKWNIRKRCKRIVETAVVLQAHHCLSMKFVPAVHAWDVDQYLVG